MKLSTKIVPLTIGKISHFQPAPATIMVNKFLGRHVNLIRIEWNDVLNLNLPHQFGGQPKMIIIFVIVAAFVAERPDPNVSGALKIVLYKPPKPPLFLEVSANNNNFITRSIIVEAVVASNWFFVGLSLLVFSRTVFFSAS